MATFFYYLSFGSSKRPFEFTVESTQGNHTVSDVAILYVQSTGSYNMPPS